MQQFLATLADGFLALLGVATLVALWEHLRRAARHPAAPPEAVAPRAAHVDLDLSALDAGLAAGDQVQRQAAVSNAMSRMAQPGNPGAWTETRPMVAPGSTVETESPGL